MATAETKWTKVKLRSFKKQLDSFHDMMVKKFPESASYPMNTFARFLMGYRYDVNECTARFSAFAQWAKTTNIMSLKPEDFPQFQSAAQPFRVIGKTKKGHALILLQLKNLKIRNFSIEDFGKYVGSMVNTALNGADTSLDQYYMIIDVKDYTKENFDMDGMKKLIPIFSNYFPDVLYKQAIINLGYLASKAFGMLMLFMHEVTRSKMKLVRDNLEQIKAVLLEDIDLDNIPIAYGGSNPVNLL